MGVLARSPALAPGPEVARVLHGAHVHVDVTAIGTPANLHPGAGLLIVKRGRL